MLEKEILDADEVKKVKVAKNSLLGMRIVIVSAVIHLISVFTGSFIHSCGLGVFTVFVLLIGTIGIILAYWLIARYFDKFKWHLLILMVGGNLYISMLYHMVLC